MRIDNNNNTLDELLKTIGIDKLKNRLSTEDCLNTIKDGHLFQIYIHEFSIRKKKEYDLDWIKTRQLVQLLNFLFLMKIHNGKTITEYNDSDIVDAVGLVFSKNHFEIKIETLNKNLKLDELCKDNLYLKYMKIKLKK